ncbi:MAG: hypothetical protein JRE40_14720 [Deltaproteobacteria bacterium]|nr:hypothetical protein [Deltaproteobacteria bacterium]MBW2672680.1 hypothetical protein [Deltaproteobacteria bacterium]
MQEITPFNETFPAGAGQAEALSVREANRLDILEGVVRKNFRAFYEVGCALREIRDAKLYRTSHDTFDHYVKDVFEIARNTAYQYVDAADVVDNIRCRIENVRHGGQNEILPGNGMLSRSIPDEPETPAEIPLPANERQARVLAPLDPEKQAEVWQKALDTAPDGRITASLLKQTAKDYSVGEIKKAIKKTRTPTDKERIDAEFKAAFDAALDQVSFARDDDWKHTSKEMVTRYLVGMLQAVAGDGREDVSHRMIEDVLGEHLMYSGSDSVKLLNAGFSVYRKHEYSREIVQLSTSGGWRKHGGPYPTKKAMNDEWRQLLAGPMAIGG